METLEKTKRKILNYVKNKGFSIFYGSTHVRNGVVWNQGQADWKNFVNIAEDENVKTLVYFDCTLADELEELSTAIGEYQMDLAEREDVQILKEFRSKLKSFEKFSDKIAWIQLSWIKGGVQYLLQLSSSWYEDFVKIQGEIQELLKEKEKTVSLEEKRESLKETKEKLSVLSEQIIQWAKSQELKRVTKNQVQVYLLENEIPLGWTDRQMLYTMVNRELSKSHSE